MDEDKNAQDFGTLLVVRHGQTAWSRSGKHTSVTDLPLLAEGEDQARALAPLLAAYAPSRVISSPLIRARHTAELAGLNDIELDAGLTEWHYGGYEGRTRADIQTERPGWSIFSGTPRGGELITDVAARAGRIIEKVIGDLESGRTVALVTHGHFSRVLLSTWLGLAPSVGRFFPLDAGAVGALGSDRGQRVVHHWNQRPNAADR